MEKEYLLTPGPTPIPERVARAMDKRLLHHRTDVFKKYFKSALEALQWLTDSETAPIFLASSGTGAMEASLINCCNPGDTILVLNGGAFGERWSKIARKVDLNVIEIKTKWGETITEEQLTEALNKNPEIKAFCLQYCETSSCVLHPIESLIKKARQLRPEIITIVDAISALATAPLSAHKFDIDVLVVASQKALMLPPGLSALLINNRTWKIIEQRKVRSFYFDLLAERKAHNEITTAWTPATTLIIGLAESIAMIKEEGLDNVIARHDLLGRACRSAVQALDLQLLAPQYPAPAVTGFFPPDGVQGNALRKEMLTTHKVRVAGGQGEFKDSLVRIGHMGFIDKFDLLTGIAALELSLTTLLAGFSPGKATQAALKVFANK